MKLTAFAFSVWFSKVIKFALTGSLGLMVDFGITFFCKEKLRWNKFLSNSIGFSFAVVQNFFLNRVWTFSNHDEHIALQFSKFLFVAVAGLILNNLFLYILLKYSGEKYFYLCKVVVTGIVFIWNFLANSFYTFK
jgi:putative flippase GtrA